MITFAKKDDSFNAITHGGTHHADDVFGIVLAEKLLGNARIYRLPFDENINSISDETLVFDTLGGKFDHHQRGGNGFHKLQDNSKKPIPMASFGLLWKQFGQKILNFDADKTSFIKEFVNNYLVRSIDAADNGVFPSIEGFENLGRIPSISCIISLLNLPSESRPENDNQNTGLLLAIDFAKVVFEQVIDMGQMVYDGVFADKNYHRSLCKRFLNDNVCVPLKRFLNSNYFWDNEQYHNAKKYIYSFLNGIVNDLNLSSFTAYSNSKYDQILVLTLVDSISRDMFYNDFKNKNLFLSIIEQIVINIQENCKYKILSKSIVENAIKNQKGKRILVLDEKVFWQDFVAKNTDAKSFWFVVAPSERGWKVQPIPCKYTENGFRKGFPQKWYGYNKGNYNIKAIPKNVEFIHSQGFLAISKTKEDAIKLCENAFGNNECKLISKTPTT